MENGGAIVLVVSALIVYMIYDTYWTGNLKPVKAKDGNTYMVQNLPDAQKAADIIADIRANLETVIKHMEKTQPDDKRTELMVQNFRGDNLSEAPAGNKNTSYSINKGEKIVICLRTKDARNKLEDFNDLMFVLIHELAHLATEGIGHTPEFWENFKWLLEEAVNIGVYKYVDYAKEPHEYCSMTITSNPLSKK